MSSLKQRKDVTAEILVGAFMFTILAVLLVVSVVISQNKFFEESYEVTANFSSVEGLREGEEVFLRGLKIGFVETIEIREGMPGVYVVMNLTQPVTLYQDYEVEVVVASMLGGMRVMIREGTPELGEIPEEAYARLEGKEIKNLLAAAGETVQEVQKSLADDGTLDNLEILAKNFADLSTTIANGEGTLGKLINEDTLYNEVTELATNLNTASKDVKEIAARMNQGEGTLGRLLSEDEALYEDLEKAIANVRKVSQDLADGKGALGKLLSSQDDFYEDLRDTLASLKIFSEDLAAQEGTIGKLINDETLYIKVESLVDEARSTIDDFRETSPITTFSSIFFGAF